MIYLYYFTVGAHLYVICLNYYQLLHQEHHDNKGIIF